jgi:DNA-binding transcriptional regulator GbsR (MarR family)
VDPYEGRVVAEFARFFEQEGYARIMGQVFARLLLRSEPMALRELAADLGVSRASISTDTRRLERQGILERVRRAGDRRAYYRLALDLPDRIMLVRIDRLKRFQALIQTAMADAPTSVPAVRARLQELDRAHAHMIEAMTEMLSQWRRGGATASPSPRPNPRESRDGQVLRKRR